MENEVYDSLKALLKNRPKKLAELTQWLFVVVNTAKAIIDNTSKKDSGNVARLSECGSTSEVQRAFDVVQGKYGREGFSGRRGHTYTYLCSLVANYPNRDLTDQDRELIRKYSAVDTYLLYTI